MSEENPVGWEDTSPVVLTEIKCTECGCRNHFIKDEPEYLEILEKGYGNPVRYGICEKVGICGCHNGMGKLPRILNREHEVKVTVS